MKDVENLLKKCMMRSNSCAPIRAGVSRMSVLSPTVEKVESFAS